MVHRKFWLASNSPRRKEMFTWINWDWGACAANIDESQLPFEHAQEYVVRLAAEKANNSIPGFQEEDVVVAADTIVVLDDTVLGKPINDEHAYEMLTSLRGRDHYVMTAIAVRRMDHANLRQDLCKTKVHMRAYTDQEIARYIDSGDPRDKAGAYAIQNENFHPAIKFKGCYSSVMGMPLCHLERTIRGIPDYEPKDLALICQNHLKYTCPITTRVMAGEDIG
jgi:septum formation protein